MGVRWGHIFGISSGEEIALAPPGLEPIVAASPAHVSNANMGVRWGHIFGISSGEAALLAFLLAKKSRWPHLALLR
jgi:hypothetical protein